MAPEIGGEFDDYLVPRVRTAARGSPTTSVAYEVVDTGSGDPLFVSHPLRMVTV